MHIECSGNLPQATHGSITKENSKMRKNQVRRLILITLCLAMLIGGGAYLSIVPSGKSYVPEGGQVNLTSLQYSNILGFSVYYEGATPRGLEPIVAQDMPPEPIHMCSPLGCSRWTFAFGGSIAYRVRENQLQVRYTPETWHVPEQ